MLDRNGAGDDEMTDKPALNILALVEAALSETEGKKARQVYAEIDIGSLRMVHTCLRWLCREGRARYEGPERAGSIPHHPRRCRATQVMRPAGRKGPSASSIVNGPSPRQRFW